VDTQTFENHRRVVPGFHMVTFFLLVLNLIGAVVSLVRSPSILTDSYVLLSVAAGLLFVYVRQFATSNQDRIIRLEMATRFQRLAPDLVRAAECACPQPVDGTSDRQFTIGQLVALRFASDEELPGLARQVLANKVTDGNQIKRMVKNWRADYARV
jgi:hypothetical protein